MHIIHRICGRFSVWRHKKCGLHSETGEWVFCTEIINLAVTGRKSAKCIDISDF